MLFRSDDDPVRSNHDPDVPYVFTVKNGQHDGSIYASFDFPKYSYDDFYAVSNAPTADVFRCLETGRNYIPGENELFGYEGEFQPYLKPEAEKIVTEPHNFRIQDNDLGAGGPKAKYKANMEAIHLLQTLEKEERLATPEEQESLSRYVGWGGIPQAFEENNSSWAMSQRLVVAKMLTEKKVY